jgi:hypothetical protein
MEPAPVVSITVLNFSFKIVDLSANMEVKATNTLAYCCTASIAAVKGKEKTRFMTV